jgi:hypothetical protein
MKQYKIQNRSQNYSHSCVPLREVGMYCLAQERWACISNFKISGPLLLTFREVGMHCLPLERWACIAYL